MRNIEVDLWDILDLVACAMDYGFNDDVLMCSFYDFAGDVSDEELREFADSYVTPEKLEEGYTMEDHAELLERVTEWRDKHREAASRRTE